jgi:4-diphosphocytidyl-2-C-methyl-D-erythritol kinase
MQRGHAYAKVNLFLRVLAREAGGFHQIESLLCTIGLHDDLEIDGGTPGISLKVEGDIATGETRENLVWRAAESFFVRAGIRPNAHMTLHKRIPAGAGLGGGSSDAATALVMLNRMHGSPLDASVLLELAATLGSDVPFFVTRAPLAIAWGRGERLLSLPGLPPIPTLVAAPAARIATGDAYAALDNARAGRTVVPVPLLLSGERLGSWDDFERMAVNDFEQVAIDRVPIIRSLLDCLRACDARIALLCGSGSACFATFADERSRAAAARTVRESFGDTCVFETACGVDPSQQPV